MTDTEQTRLDVGDTRKTIAIKNEQRVTTGDLAALAMCAHRFEPDDVAGWYTHDFDDVVRQWIASSVGAVIARLSPHCEDERGHLPPLHRSHELSVEEADDGPKQTKLMTDGGQVVDSTESVGTRWGNECARCGHLEKRDYGPGRYPSADRCPECDWPMNCVDLDIIDRSIPRR